MSNISPGSTRPIEPLVSRPIGDYALLSDCHSTALVTTDGSIDWACLRRFDSGSTFGRLLDPEHGGHFSIRPTATILEYSRRYVGATMVLETTMRTATGTLVLTDACAMRRGGSNDPHTQILRRAECVAGSLEVDIEIVPRFDYGTLHPWVQACHDPDGSRFSAVGGDDALVVHATVDLYCDHEEARLEGTFALDAGETLAVTVVAQAAHLLDPSAADVDVIEQQLGDTLEWWEAWSADSDIGADRPYRSQLERSALILKSLTCAPTGAIIAAPTTSLPEIPGGSKNWDYRYCWVRDATLTLDALAAVGHHEVAQGFRNFIMRSAAGRGDELQIMYGAYGERRLIEFELDHLPGWRDSLPVRVGNGAATQIQLDVYGHLLDAAQLWHGLCVGGEFADDEDLNGGIDEDEWRFLVSVVDQAEARRDDTDAGIWELRGEDRHYVHSKVMVWVALDRGIKLVEEYDLSLDADHVERWRAAREDLRTKIETQGVDATTGGFVQYYGSSDVDASLLKLPLVGFVDATDPRMVATVDAIRRDLCVGEEKFLLRFRDEAADGTAAADDDAGDDADAGDGAERHEGVFLLCTFWLVEVLALQGHLDEAHELFERLCGVANDVGLLAEEYDSATDELLGNFPQAFTHLGLIVAEQRLRSCTPSTSTSSV